MPISAVSFDLDGTLADIRWRRLRLGTALLRHGPLLLAWQRAAKGWRGRRTLDLDGALAEEAAAVLRMPAAAARRILAEEIDDRWPRCFAGAQALAPAAALIAALDAAGVPRVVVSDHAAVGKLQAMGIGGWSAIISCRALGALKPLPDGLHAALAHLGLPPASLLHVGDRWDTDGAAAAAVGCAFRHISQVDPRRPLAGLTIAAPRGV